MKKALATLLALTLLSCCFGIGAKATGSKTYEAAWGSPVIDGTVDDVWSSATASAFAVGTGSIRILNDAEYVYLLVEIQDATNEVPGNDIFYVLFDLDNDGAFDDEKIQLNFEKGNAVAIVGGVVQDSPAHFLVDWNQSATATGYRYEIKLQNAQPESGSLLTEIFYREKGGTGSEAYWCGGNPSGWPTNAAPTSNFANVIFAENPSGGSEPEVPVGDYNATWGTPVIDGTVDEVWNDAPASAFAVGTGSIRILNDAEYVYLLVEIQDATNEVPGNDIFYVLFDLDNDGEFDGEKIQLNFEKGNVLLLWGGAVADNPDYFLVDWNQSATATGYRYEIKLENAMPESGSLLMEFFYREKGGTGSEAYWRGGNPNGWPTNAAPTSNFGEVVFALDPNPAPAGEIVEDGGELYYREDGVGVMAGLVKVGDDYYFAGWNGKIVKNKLQNIWANATGEAAFDGKNRVFGADGKMANGLVTVGDDFYYCVDGKPTMAGLVKDGDDVYFIGGEGKAVKNKLQNVWANSTDDASFTGKNRAFGADGKLLTGILNDVYYKDGVATMAGLVEVDGDLYFASGAGQIVKNKTQYIWANSTDNADLTGTSQTFGADGKLAA